MTVEINSSARPSVSVRFDALYALYDRYADLVWMIGLALVAIEYALHYNLFLQAIPHDTTFHIYAAQQMLEGHPIYRDVAIIKAPLADFAAALAILGARWIGISDIMGTRLMSLLVAAATTSATFLAGRVLFRARAIGILAGILMAGWDFYGLRSITGPEPKAFLILFSLLGFVCLAQRRWFWAGVCAAFAALAWQPGLMLAAIALAFALGDPYLPKDSDRTTGESGSSAAEQRVHSMGWSQAGRVLAGLAVPLLALVGYLAANAALSAAWNAAIGANLTHFENAQATTPLAQLIALNYAEILADGGQYCFSPLEDWLVIGGAAGFVGITLALVATVLRGRLAGARRLGPLVLYTFGFCAFTLIDFDFCPDLFPLLPVLALSVAWLIWTAGQGLGWTVRRVLPGAQTAARWIPYLFAGAAAVYLAYVYLLDVRAYRVTGVTFQDQLDVVQVAREYLEPGDSVLSFGNTIVPVELHLPNAHKILHLGSKSGLGVLASEPGGVQGMVDTLERNPPKLVTLARENRPAWTAPIYAWLDAHYQQAEIFPRANMRLLVRKP